MNISNEGNRPDLTKLNNNEAKNFRLKVSAIGMASILGATAIGVGARIVFGGSSKNQTVTAESNNSNLGNTVSTSKSNSNNIENTKNVQGENLDEILPYVLKSDDIDNLTYDSTQADLQWKIVPKVDKVVNKNEGEKFVFKSEWGGKDGDFYKYITSDERLAVIDKVIQNVATLVHENPPIDLYSGTTYKNEFSATEYWAVSSHGRSSYLSDQDFAQFDYVINDGKRHYTGVRLRFPNGSEIELSIASNYSNRFNVVNNYKGYESTYLNVNNHEAEFARDGVNRVDDLVKLDEKIINQVNGFLSSYYKALGYRSNLQAVPDVSYKANKITPYIFNDYYLPITDVSKYPDRSLGIKWPDYMIFALAPDPNWQSGYGETAGQKYLHSTERLQMYNVFLQKVGRLIDDNKKWVGPVTIENFGNETEVYSQIGAYDPADKNKVKYELLYRYFMKNGKKVFTDLYMSPYNLTNNGVVGTRAFFLSIRPSGVKGGTAFLTQGTFDDSTTEYSFEPEDDTNLDYLIANDMMALKSMDRTMREYFSPKSYDVAKANEVQFGENDLTATTVAGGVAFG